LPAYLLTFSCKTRGLRPSCSAKRGAAFGALLAEEVIEDVGHTHWTFTMPKMLAGAAALAIAAWPGRA
jgi:hypothetical protein